MRQPQRKRRKTMVNNSSSAGPSSAAASQPALYCVDGVCAARPPTDPAPSTLNSEDCAHHLTCAPNLLSVEYDGPGREEKDAAAVRADVPVPSAGLAMYYFEARILNAGATGRIGVGLCGKDVRLEKMPGWEQNSYGYHGDDGCAFKTTGVAGEKYGPKYGAGDTVGCCWDLVNNVVFFTRNGIMLGTAFRDVKGTLYPTVGMQTKGGRVSVNFGTAAFEFDLEKYAREQQQRVLASALAPAAAAGEDSIADAVLGYMIHAGYAKSARAFAKDAGRHQVLGEDGKAGAPSLSANGKEALGAGAVSDSGEINGSAVAMSSKSSSAKPPLNGSPLECGGSAKSSFLCMDGIEDRQEALAQVMRGDVNGAQEFARSKFPNLCVDDPETAFLLKSQHFIELLVAGNQPIEATVQYGREDLISLYDAFPKRMQEVCSLLAYTDPAKSPVAHLVSPERRVLVADSLNRAILKSQDLPSKAVLEKLVAQLQAVIDMHADVTNGPACLLRGVDDFR